MQPYRVSFDRVACGAAFHQCVYVLCATDAATMQAGAAARAAYGQDPAAPYMPHLSLLYSDMPAEDRWMRLWQFYNSVPPCYWRPAPTLLPPTPPMRCRQRIMAEEQQRLFGGGDAALLQGEELGFGVDSLTGTVLDLRCAWGPTT